DMEVDITTPHIGGGSGFGGGSFEKAGGFPAQEHIFPAGGGGGEIGIRSIASAGANAGVKQGGLIKMNGSRSLRAAVNEGGDIVYWGNPDVSQAVNEGGDVHKGG